jgi:hypothetical protein
MSFRAVVEPGEAATVLVLSGDRVAHLPRAMLRVMSVVMRPLKPQLARMARASVVMDSQDMTFDGSETRREFPGLPFTDLTTALKQR